MKDQVLDLLDRQDQQRNDLNKRIEMAVKTGQRIWIGVWAPTMQDVFVSVDQSAPTGYKGDGGKYFMEYSYGGIFIEVPDELGELVARDQRWVRRLETGQTIEAEYNGRRIQIRMQKLRPETSGDKEQQ